MKNFLWKWVTYKEFSTGTKYPVYMGIGIDDPLLQRALLVLIPFNVILRLLSNGYFRLRMCYPNYRDNVYYRGRNEGWSKGYELAYNNQQSIFQGLYLMKKEDEKLPLSQQKFNWE